jgi:hypothetical protein
MFSTPTKSSFPNPKQTASLQSMAYAEFCALGRGLLSLPPTSLAAPPKGSAASGCIRNPRAATGAQVALLQSPILRPRTYLTVCCSKNEKNEKKQISNRCPLTNHIPAFSGRNEYSSTCESQRMLRRCTRRGRRRAPSTRWCQATHALVLACREQRLGLILRHG